jgi:hypothetical protein
MRFLQQSVLFRFFGLGFDLPTSWRGRFRYPLYYGYTTFGAFGVAFLFCIQMWLLASVNYLCLERASLWDFVVLLLLFLLFLLNFFFLFTGCWLESSVRDSSFFREVFVLFSFKFRSSFAPRRVASCPPTICNRAREIQGVAETNDALFLEKKLIFRANLTFSHTGGLSELYFMRPR